MSDKLLPIAEPGQPLVYEIRLEGHLGGHWLAWFEDTTITLEPNGATRLTCVVADQAALHALLRKVRDLGIPLLAVTRVEGSPGV